MVVHRTQGYVGALLLTELVCASIAFWVWVLVWDTVSSQVFETARCTLLNEFLLLGLVLGAGPGRHTSSGQNRAEEARAARRQTLGGLFAMFVVAAVAPSGGTPRVFLMSFAPVLYLVLRTGRHYLPRWVARLLFDRSQPEQVLIVGTPAEASRLSPWLKAKESFGLRAVGLVCDEEAAPAATHTAKDEAINVAEWGGGWDPDGTEWRPRLPGRTATLAAPVNSVRAKDAEAVHPRTPVAGPVWSIPWLGSFVDLERILDARQIGQVLVLGLRWPEGFLQRCIAACEHRGIRLHVASDLDDYFRHTVTLIEDSGVQLIGLREEPLESPVNRFLKRVMDLAIALPIALLVLPPAVVLVWLLHRWQSPGPVFFRQFRTGLRGRRFLMCKFRTMSVQNDDETRQVRRSDPRVFPAGGWMRRFSMDELPQFLNVLWGDMSVVGPRPHLPAHDEIFMQAMQNYRVRSAVKPGITGLAQMRGFRGGTQTDEDITRRVSSDIEYLERWTLELDVWILFRTLWQVVAPPKGAY